MDEPIATKPCKRCIKLNKPNPEKELWEFPRKRGDKLSEWCKECHKEYSKENYRKNPEKKIKKVQEWQKNNRPKIINHQKKYRQKSIKLMPQPKVERQSTILDNILPISPRNNK